MPGPILPAAKRPELIKQIFLLWVFAVFKFLSLGVLAVLFMSRDGLERMARSGYAEGQGESKQWTSW